MLKKLILGIVVVLFLIGGAGAAKFLFPIYAVLEKVGPGTAPRDLVLQDDSKAVAPYLNVTAELAGEQPTADVMASAETNLYWGELHLHTSESFDASMMGNKLSIEDAYRFAKGDPLMGPGGETMQLSRPLDFVAITDHAEGFGSRTHCDDLNLSLRERATCWLMGMDQVGPGERRSPDTADHILFRSAVSLCSGTRSFCLRRMAHANLLLDLLPGQCAWHLLRQTDQRRSS